MKYLVLLAQTKILWVTFCTTIVLTLSFGVVMYLGQFTLIDEMFSAKEIQTHIAAMTPHQRSLHAWMTGTIDVAYPFAYGAFFIGVAIKYFGRMGLWLALPSILVIPADLTEGFSQIMLLTGSEDFMDLKLIATPVKLVLYIAGLGITTVGLFLMLRRRFGDDLPESQ